MPSDLPALDLGEDAASLGLEEARLREPEVAPQEADEDIARLHGLAVRAAGNDFPDKIVAAAGLKDGSKVTVFYRNPNIRDLLPRGFLPLPHVKHETGGMVFRRDAIGYLVSANVDAATVSDSTIALVRAGPDAILGTADDVTIIPASITVNGAAVTMNLAGATLLDDTYGIKISGRGIAPPPHPGLFAHWALDEGTGTAVADKSGNNRHGALNGPTWSDGIFGNALAFDGGAPRVDIDAGLVFPEWTASLWVHRSADVLGTAATLMDRVATTTNTSLRLEQAAGNDVGFTEYTIVDYGSGYVASIGSWIHLVFACDSTELRFYVDGVLVHTAPNSWELSVDKLGSASAARSDSLLGYLDEIQVYDRILTDDEIASLAVISGCVQSAGGRVVSAFRVRCIRSCAPFCSGWLGSLRTCRIPSRIHHTLSCERRPNAWVEKGTPLSVRRISGRPYSWNSRWNTGRHSSVVVPLRPRQPSRYRLKPSWTVSGKQ